MQNSIAAVLREVIADLRPLQGAGETPNQPPEQINGPWPAIIAYAESGAFRMNTTRGVVDMPSAWALHSISIRVHVPRKDLPYDMESLAPFVDSVPEALLAGFIRDRFGGTIVALGDARSPGASAAIRYEIGNDTWGGVDTIAARFTLDVTVENAVGEDI